MTGEITKTDRFVYFPLFVIATIVIAALVGLIAAATMGFVVLLMAL